MGVMWPQAACTHSSEESLAQPPPSPLGWGCKSPPFQGQGGERDGDSCAMADPGLAVPGKTAGGGEEIALAGCVGRNFFLHKSFLRS